MSPRSYGFAAVAILSVRHACTSTFCFLQEPVDTNLPAFVLLLLSGRPAAAKHRHSSSPDVWTRRGNSTQFLFFPLPQTSGLYIALDLSSRSPVKTEKGGGGHLFCRKSENSFRGSQIYPPQSSFQGILLHSRLFPFDGHLICKQQRKAPLKRGSAFSCGCVISATPSSPSARQMPTKVCDTIKSLSPETVSYWRCCRIYGALKSAVLHA